MKRCPACAEKIQDAARLCRFCDHRLSEEELKDSGTGIGTILAILVGGALLVGMCSGGSDTSTTDKTSAFSKAAQACDLMASRRLLNSLRRERFILADTTNGVAVDERLWRQFSLGQRRGVAVAVACARTGGVADSNAYVSIRASDGATMIAAGMPFAGSFRDRD